MADYSLVIVLQQIMSLVGLLSHYLLRLLTDCLFVLLVVRGSSLYAHARLFFLFNFLLDFCSRSSAPYGPGMCTTAFLQIYPVSLGFVFTEILRNRIDRNRNGFACFGFVWTGPQCLVNLRSWNTPMDEGFASSLALFGAHER